MNNYVNTEKSLKRWLKTRVKVTMATIVGFLITGTVAFGVVDTKVQSETIDGKAPLILREGEKYIKQDSLSMKFENNTERRGILVETDKKTTSIPKAKIETSNDLNIFVNHYDAVGICARNGGEVDITSKNVVINALTEEVDPKITNPKLQYSIAMGLDVDKHSDSPGLQTKGGKVNITADTVNIVAEAKQDAGWAYGINCITRTTDFDKDNVSRVVIKAKDTNIKAITKTKGASNGIIAWSQGEVLINDGNVNITADNIINTRGKSLVELNKNNLQNTVKLNGDIVFEYNAKQSGTTIDSDVIINLATEKSEFNGKIYTDGGATPAKSIINGMRLGLSNGGKWNVSGDSLANEITIKDGGKISFGDKEYKTLEMWNREEATDKLVAYDKGIQMQGGAIVEGNGSIIAYDLDLTGDEPAKEVLTKTVYGNAITVTNKGNILDLGKDSVIRGNVLVETGADLENKGMLNMAEGTLSNSGTVNLSKGATINLASGSTLTNDATGIINVASGATAIAGTGTAENNGFINLADTDKTDGNISTLLDGATLTNKGTIALEDKTGTMTDEKWNELLNSLVINKGKLSNLGMVIDSTGKTIFADGTVIEGNTTSGEIIDSGVTESGSIKIDGDTTITGSTSTSADGTTTIDTLDNLVVNVTNGNLALNQGSGNGAGVVMNNVTMNVETGKNITTNGSGHDLSGSIILNGNSSVVVGDKSDLTLSGEISQGKTTETEVPKVEIKENGTLNLVNARVNVAINGGEVGKVTSEGTTTIKDITASSLEIKKDGKEVNTTVIDGKVDIGEITIGSLKEADNKTNILVLSADTVLGNTKQTKDTSTVFRAVPTNSKVNKITIGGKDGQLALELGKNQENALGNSTGIEIKGTSTTTNNKDLLIKTSTLTGKEYTINLGDNKFTNVGAVTDSKIYVLDKILNGETIDGKDTTVKLEYNTKLFEDNGILNNMNSQAFNVGAYLSVDENTRKDQLDKLYSSNIYAETVRASYDTFKLNEDTVLSMNTKSKVGELVAEGKALYSKSEYDRTGTLKDRTSENETTGLLANLAYGLDDKSSLGFVLSGAKQDIDTDGGSADGDLFYFGAYKDTIVGKANVRTGVAYQLGKYDADNLAGDLGTKDSYNTNAYGLYTQATFKNDLGNGLSLQPKLRAGLTHVEQDAIKDAYFGLDDTEITTFDLTLGADLVKTVQFDKAVVEFKVGTDYTYTMGDTDKEFQGSFKDGTESFDILGAEIAENTFAINLGAEVTCENGFFYNGGLTYKFGSDDNSSYGASIGVGFTF